MGYLGNGLTVWNRAVEESGDYQTIAHISDEGEIHYYVDGLPEDVVARIEQAAAQEQQKSLFAASYQVGDRVYLDGKPFEITRVDDWNVELMDRSEQNPQPRLESKDNFMQLVQQNERSNRFTDAYREYGEIKEENPDSLVLYQVGDFFEAYGADAQTVSEALELNLTSRFIGNNQRTQMCGFPANRLETYINMLLDRGFDYSKLTGEWNVEGKSYDRGNLKAYNTYGTKRVNAYKIIEDTLNMKDVRVFDYMEDDEGKKRAILNKKETAIAQSKQELIKQGFQDWVWRDPERREKLVRLYNEKFNSIRPREYDGMDDLKERIDELNGVVSVGKKEISEKREQLKKLENLEKMAEVIKTNQPLIDEYNRFYFQKRREKYYQQHKKEINYYRKCERELKQHLDKNGKVPTARWKREKEELRTAIEELKADKQPYQDELAFVKKVQTCADIARRDREMAEADTSGRSEEKSEKQTKFPAFHAAQTEDIFEESGKAEQQPVNQQEKKPEKKTSLLRKLDEKKKECAERDAKQQAVREKRNHEMSL